MVCFTCSKGFRFFATELAKGPIDQVIDIVGNAQTIPGAIYAIKIFPKDPIPRDKFEGVKNALSQLPVKVLDVSVSENEIQVMFEGSPMSLSAIIAALPGLLMLIGIIIVAIVLLLILIKEPALFLAGLAGVALFGVGYMMMKGKLKLPTLPKLPGTPKAAAILPREVAERELLERGFIV